MFGTGLGALLVDVITHANVVLLVCAVAGATAGALLLYQVTR